MKFLITTRYKIKNKKQFFYLDIGWRSFFKSLNAKYKIYKKNLNKNSLLDNDYLIISGGGDIYNISKNKYDLKRDNEEIKLIKLFINKKKPIIVICRGFQLLANFYKNKLIRVRNHVNKNHIIKLNKNLISNKKKINTNSYHNFGMRKLNKKFSVVGKTKDNLIEIAFLKNKKVLCLMFHPERYNKNQDSINELILNFLKNKWN